MEIPKQLFAILSVAGLGMAAACAWMVRRDRKLLVLVPLLGSLSITYLYQSWTYINVDILGAFFVWATLTNLLIEHYRSTGGAKTPRLALTQGLLAGLTIGCKYNLFPIVLPYLVYSCFFVRERLVARALTLFAATAVGFVLSTPYAILSFDEFIEGAAREAYHYATSHGGKSTEAGWPVLLAHVQDFRESYGITLLSTSVLGVAALFRANYRIALTTCAFPFAFLAYMTGQQVFFARNSTSLHLFIAFTAAIGLVELGRLLGVLAAHWRSSPSRWLSRALVVAPLASLIVLGPSWPTLAQAYSRRIESRHDVASWLARHAPKAAPIFIDDDLGMDIARVGDHLEVSLFDGTRSARVKRMLGWVDERETFFLVPLRDGEFVKELESLGARVVYRGGTEDLLKRTTNRHPDPKLVVLRLPAGSRTATNSQ